MTTITAETEESGVQFPGNALRQAREEKGYSTEYVAGRLHLRVRVIELLEADDYPHLPEPVFVKGYIRAYAKLIDVDYEPLLASFNAQYRQEYRPERMLWQSQPEVNKGAHLVRWFTLISIGVVLTAVGIWWHQAKDSLLGTKLNEQVSLGQKASEKVTLTDLNKMHTVVELPNKDVKRG
ncbi:MAG: helix-turn-helix domain-containing protein [Legionellaceae bacterium]|nr:helix-turn-helix domain-containing protein [Legionellaceae bacterium]